MPLQFLATDRAVGADVTAAKLRAYLDVSKPQTFMRRSFDDLPQYIQLLGNSAGWLALAAAAAIFLKSYLSKLGELAAEGSVDFFKRLRRVEGVEPIAEVAVIFAAQRESLGEKGSIHIGVSLLNAHSGAVLVIKSNDTLEIARSLAIFVSHVAKLEEVMKNEIDEGRKPLGDAIITLEEGGGLTIEWVDQAMMSRHRKHIP